MDAKQLGDTPAFACEGGGQFGPWPGMTLRQWYAGMAFAAISANPHYSHEKWSESAASARRGADALLAELAKEQG